MEVKIIIRRDILHTNTAVLERRIFFDCLGAY